MANSTITSVVAVPGQAVATTDKPSFAGITLTADSSIASSYKLFFDGGGVGGDTCIYELGGNELAIAAGGIVTCVVKATKLEVPVGIVSFNAADDSYISVVGTHMDIIAGGGQIGIGTAHSASYNCKNNGSLYTDTAYKPSGGSWTDSCDERLKKNIGKIDNALEKLLSLTGHTFEWKKPEKHSPGVQMHFISQEVEKVFPNWVGSIKLDEEDTGEFVEYKDLTVKGFEALAVEAIRELKNEIDLIKNKLNIG